jgi:hypothetical protein
MQKAERRTQTRTADCADFADSVEPILKSLRAPELFSEFSRFQRAFNRQVESVLSSEHLGLYQKWLGLKPSTGGVPCPGSGGRWGRNPRHGESKSWFRPQQLHSRPRSGPSIPSGGSGAAAPESASFLNRNQTSTQIHSAHSCGRNQSASYRYQSWPRRLMQSAEIPFSYSTLR